MFELFGAALPDGMYTFMRISYFGAILFYILGILSTILLLIGHFSKNTKLKKSIILGPTIATAILSIVLCLFDFFAFYSEDSISFVPIIVLFLSLVCALLVITFCFVFYSKRLLLAISLLVMMVVSSLIFLPVTIDSYQTLYEEHYCDCEDWYVTINGKEISVPCCPV